MEQVHQAYTEAWVIQMPWLNFLIFNVNDEEQKHYSKLTFLPYPPHAQVRKILSGTSGEIPLSWAILNNSERAFLPSCPSSSEKSLTYSLMWLFMTLLSIS